MGRKFLIAQPWATQAQGRAQLPADVDEIERISPSRQPSLESDVMVPAAWSFITGAMATLVFLAAAIASGAPLWPAWAGGLGIMGCAWLWKSSVIHSLLQDIEIITNRDIDGDGQIGNQEPPAPRTIEVHLKDGAGHTRIVSAGWLEMDDDNLLAFAAAVARGRSLAEGDIGKDKGIFPGINDFRQVRARLVEAGLVALVVPGAPSQGYKFTPAGRAFIRGINAHTHAHAQTGASCATGRKDG